MPASRSKSVSAAGGGAPAWCAIRFTPPLPSDGKAEPKRTEPGPERPQINEGGSDERKSPATRERATTTMTTRAPVGAAVTHQA